MAKIIDEKENYENFSKKINFFIINFEGKKFEFF